MAAISSASEGITNSDQTQLGRRGSLLTGLVLGMVSVLVAAPLLHKGSLFLLDFAMTPHMHVQWVATDAAPGPVNGAVFASVLWALSRIDVIPAFVLIFALTLGCALAMSQLVRSLFPEIGVGTRIATGIFYAVNPFTYIRLVHGQIGTQAGMCLWALSAAYLVRLRRNRSVANAVYFGLAIGGVGLVSIHAFVMLIVVLPAMFIFIGWPGLKNAVIAGVTTLLLSAFWIVQLFTVRPVAPSGADLQAFATTPVGYRSLQSVASMYGFWRIGEFPLPKDQIPYWYVFFAPLVILMIVGAVIWFRRSKAKATALMVMIVLSALLACGISFPPTAGAFRFLFNHVPGFGIFREPQKWVAVEIFGYALLLALGVDALTKYFANKPEGSRRPRIYPETIAALLIGLVLLNAKPMLLSSALEPSRFPRDWYTADRMMHADNHRALILPWHLYLNLPFVKHRVSNPAPEFFTVPVLSSDSIEVGSIRTESNNPDSRIVEDVLFNPGGHARLQQALKRLCIHWVVLMKGADWPSYDFLDKTPLLTRVLDGPAIRLYKVRAPECSQ